MKQLDPDRCDQCGALIGSETLVVHGYRLFCTERCKQLATCETCRHIKSKGGFGPSHEGSRFCESGSLASGGKVAHCTCDWCF